MLIVTRQTNNSKFRDIFDQMYALRARQFSQRRGWNVHVVNGLEKDRFDELRPIYIMVVSGDKRLLASLRLLSTTEPHMLSDVFPEVMGNMPLVRDPMIWESSRFCVDTTLARDFATDGINIVTRTLLSGLFTTALSHGFSNIISVYDIYLEKILRRSGCIFERLGPVVTYDDLKTVAGIFEVSPQVIENLNDHDSRIKSLRAA
ncbi:acyl-homoserine-lactone synthase [Notoacmeibacter sp. MSK16QG-6]|uniref:acyl-homoserine-lactone synthase n=1 Tax=Notoacmeibacter sp. MSK16QG-6 TaxID=2957982 RepID=UPI00209D63F4|nr:acyl-homoserine-lactone synthase [Notoacmeibacter sp. MSK16QG-6]MCP1201085.1 hypothetical protein [Notoacmeibacter sp. MSK16QG-6]